MLNLRKQYDIYLERGGKDIGYTKYRKIVELYNKEVMRQIIEEQKSLFMDHGLGSLHVIELDRKPMKSKRTGRVYTSINWPLSLEKKAKLIQQGKIPFEVIKDKNGKEIGDNGGEEWLIYNLSDKIYKFYWNRYRVKKHGTIWFPLRRIRRFHLKIVKKNAKDLSRFAHNNKVSYSKAIA